jgi:chromosome segregation ATPase
MAWMNWLRGWRSRKPDTVSVTVNTELVRRVEELTRKAETDREGVSQLLQEIQELQRQRGLLRNDLKAERKAAGDLQEKLESEKQDLIAKTVEAQQCCYRLEDNAREEAVRFQTDREMLQAEVIRLTGQLQNAITEKDERFRELCARSGELQDYGHRILVLERELSDERDRARAQELLITRLRDDVAEARTRIKDCVKATESERAQSRETGQTLANLRASIRIIKDAMKDAGAL